VVFLNQNHADYYKLALENVDHVIAAVKDDNTEEFDEDEDEDNPNDKNPFINMYPHMDILDTESKGDDDGDSYNENDLDNPPIACHHMFKPVYLDPVFPVRSVIYKHFYEPNPGTPDEQDENELL
jgi:hypothetical protein